MDSSGKAAEPAGRILVVDDTPSNLRLLFNLLTQYGYVVHPATNGQAALRFLEIASPDLILLDAVMPGMDGYEVAGRLKAGERTRDIPIIFISAASQPLDKVKAFGCGAVDYIVKPFQAEEVVARLATHLALRRLQENEHRARLAAEQASRAKSVFLANMSHELRTPLNAILGYAQILKRDGRLDRRQAVAVDTIEESGEHLLTLINDILDLSRIEAGRVELHPEAVALPAFLRVVADIVRVKAELKGLAFHFETAPELPPAVQADPRRLRQILLNLLGNAVKFTDHGHVSLQVSLLPSASPGEVRLRFEVEDSGPGIDPAQQELIFQPFEQVGEVGHRLGGTGLGLAISRQLVRQMGGNIEVDSRPGQGSRFWFDLAVPPAIAPEAGPVHLEQAIVGYRGPRRRVLVADDVASNRALAADILRLTGFEVDEAADGEEVLQRVEAAPPDILVMDLVMPGLDGLEAMDRIRRLPGLERLPIIIVSASASPEDHGRSLAAGASAFLSKPVAPERLLEEVGAQLGLAWEYLAPATSGSETQVQGAELVAPPPEEMKVLHHLARTGNMKDICVQADHLADLDPRYRPFAERLRELAGSYQSKAILALVGKYMEGNP